MLIDILIPTFNRSVDLLRNLRLLAGQIEGSHLQSLVRIFVSDNCSTDGTQQEVADFIATSRTSNVELVYSRNQENIGLEGNMVRLLELATADFVLWVGDDDYLADGYLPFLVKAIEERPSLGCVISGLASLHADGSVNVRRIESFEQKVVAAGFDAAFRLSHYGNQMSGLLFRRTGLLSDYLSKPHYRNPYLFIYFVASRLLRFESIYAPRYATKVTVYNPKAWGYNDVGLLDEVFKNYLALEDVLAKDQIEDLMLRFLLMHSHRLAFRPLAPRTLSRQYGKVCTASGGSLRFKRKAAVLFVKEALLSTVGR